MTHPSNSGISRRELADEIDAIDAEIKTFNESKAAAYKDFREKLEGTGMDARRASAELAAIKAAIVRRRKLRENPDAVRKKDDLTDEILAEIMPASRVHARDSEREARESVAASGESPGIHAPPDDGDSKGGDDVTAPGSQDGENVEPPTRAAIVDMTIVDGRADALAFGSAVEPGAPIPETPAEGAPAGAAAIAHADAQSSGAATREDAVAAAPATKQWKHSDPAHPDCLDPGQCGGFSNLGLCQRCREAATGAQAA